MAKDGFRAPATARKLIAEIGFDGVYISGAVMALPSFALAG